MRLTNCNLCNLDGGACIIMFDIESSRIITHIKRGIGALYKLRAPSTTPHS